MTLRARPPELRVEALPADDAGAWALARTWLPGLGEDAWRGFVGRWLGGAGGRGLLTARSARGGVLGFVPWWTQPDLEQGEVLMAGPFVVRELGVRPLVRQALLERLRTIAADQALPVRLIDPTAANDPV